MLRKRAPAGIIPGARNHVRRNAATVGGKVFLDTFVLLAKKTGACQGKENPLKGEAHEGRTLS